MIEFSDRVGNHLDRLYEDALDYLYEKYHMSYSSDLKGLPLSEGVTDDDAFAAWIAEEYGIDGDISFGSLVV